MKVLRHIFQRSLTPIFIIFQRCLFRTDKSFFAFLFNTAKVLTRNKTKLSWNGDHFNVYDPNFREFSISIRHTGACFSRYFWGFENRIKGLEETYFLNDVPFEDGDTFIDCGASIGELHFWFRLNEININYIGFEPSPTEFSCLKRNLPAQTVLNKGLWNENGKISFFVSSAGGDSSFIEPHKFTETISIECERLENYVKGGVRCLKLEAEGAEPEVLLGLGSAISTIEYITADLGFERGPNQESTLIPVVNFLLTNGFELKRITPHGRVTALFHNMNF